MDAAEVLRRLDSDGIEHLWVTYHDYSGRSCAKTVPKERFASVLTRGVVFARANLDFNMEDHLPAEGIFQAETGDFLAVPDPASYAPVPYRRATARMHAFMYADEGVQWEGCPRTRLQGMIESYAREGLSVQVGFEPELALFEPGVDGEYASAGGDAMFTVSGLDRQYDLWLRVMECLHGMGVMVEQLGKEYGPGQYEATTRHAAPMKAADDYLTFKEVVRALAREAGLVASFMPKPYAHLAGSGLHVHMSLWDRAGERELSIGEKDDEALSPLGLQFVAGLLRHAAALTGLGAPIVNSYKRLLPGSWAPAHVCWGVSNRAVLVRVPAMGRRRHLEFRSGDNAANPYLFLTGLLAAGMDGIRQELSPPAAVGFDVGQLSDHEARERGIARLPRSLAEALDAVEADEVIREALGPVIVPEFLKVKRSELEAYNLHVHPWERRVYLEQV